MRPEDLAGAPDFKQVQTEVAELIKDRLLVGHAIHHDLKVGEKNTTGICNLNVLPRFFSSITPRNLLETLLNTNLSELLLVAELQVIQPSPGTESSCLTSVIIFRFERCLVQLLSD